MLIVDFSVGFKQFRDCIFLIRGTSHYKLHDMQSISWGICLSNRFIQKYFPGTFRIAVAAIRSGGSNRIAQINN